MELRLYLLLLFIVPTCFTQQDGLEFKTETEVQLLLKEEKYLIILFSEKEECVDVCKDLQNTLFSIREDLVEETGGWVIWTYAPQLASEIGVKKGTIIFYREGRPLLYLGSPKNEEQLLTYLVENKEPIVRNLTDSSFEHETQAGSGATTGDWLVMFTKENCELCGQLLPTLEAVGAKLKGKKNVAIVERAHGGATARRLSIKEFPAFVLFRQGKMYRNGIPVHDVNALSSFAENGFRNAKAESIPNPKSPFDDLTEATVDWLKENPTTFLACAGATIAMLAFVVLLNMPMPQSWAKKQSKKKKQ